MTHPVYLNPKIDYGFKIVFGQPSRDRLLMSFLNEILFAGQPVINEITILNPYLPGDVESIKDTYVDVQAVLANGTAVMIEMQAILQPVFFKRVLYNTAKKYSSQLEPGEYYGGLQPVISLVIGNFIFDRQRPELLRQFELTDRNHSTLYPAHTDFQIVVVELEKFNLSIEQLETVFDMWLFFLQHAEELHEVPEKMAEIEEIVTAFKTAELANLSVDELIELEKREKYALAQKEGEKLAREQAMAEGKRIGLEQGIQRGIEQGIQRGIEQGIQQGIEEGIVKEKSDWR